MLAIDSLRCIMNSAAVLQPRNRLQLRLYQLAATLIIVYGILRCRMLTLKKERENSPPPQQIQQEDEQVQYVQVQADCTEHVLIVAEPLHDERGVKEYVERKDEGSKQAVEEGLPVAKDADDKAPDEQHPQRCEQPRS
jgi:hypothetical protein